MPLIRYSSTRFNQSAPDLFSRRIDHSCAEDRSTRPGKGDATLDAVASAASPLNPDVVVRALDPLLTAHRKQRIEEVISSRLASVTVVLENLYDPHNGAAALRTCEALGIFHVHVIEGAEPFSFSRKVSKSAHKWLNIYLYSSVDSCIDYLHRCGFKCWATVPPTPGQAIESHTQITVDQPLALVFGNEHAGLTSRAIALCDHLFTIPMFGFTASLNLSVSVALSLQPAVDARRQFLGAGGDFNPELKQQLRAAYYAESTPHAVPQILRHLQRQIS